MCKATGNVEKQGNISPPKELNNFSVTNHKEMDICELPDKEFKIIILRKHSEIKRTDRQLNELKKTMHEQNEEFSKETEVIKKN